jgi:hypothetical protein
MSVGAREGAAVTARACACEGAAGCGKVRQC